MRGTLSANGWRRAACVLHEVAGEVDKTLAEAGARPAPLCVHVNDGEAGRLGIQHLGLPIDIADERGYEFLRHLVQHRAQHEAKEGLEERQLEFRPRAVMSVFLRKGSCCATAHVVV